MSWPESPCAICPRVSRGLSLPCRAQATRHRRFCQLCDPDHPDYNPAYVNLICDVAPSVPVVPAVAAPASAWEERIHLLKLRAAETCPHREEFRAGCCSATRCRPAGRRPGIVVDIATCMDCVGENFAEAMSLAGIEDDSMLDSDRDRDAKESSPPDSGRMAEWRRKLALMRSCRHWIKAGCGCQANRCLAGRGSFDGGMTAAIADCVRCIEEYEAVKKTEGFAEESNPVASSPYDIPPGHDPMPGPGFPRREPPPGKTFDPTRRPPAVAVIIPCHDYGRYLEDAVRSAAMQVPPPAEILIVDDASEDDTPTVAARLADELGIGYLRVEHRDVYRTRRDGLAYTTAPYVCFLDADDELGAGYLREATRLLESDRRLGIAYSDVEYFGDRRGISNYPATFDRGLLDRENFIHAGAVVRRAAIEESRAFDGPSPPDPGHADWYVWRRVVEAGWGAAKHVELYGYRQHPGAMLGRSLSRPYYEQAALNLAEVTIFTALAGRSWALDRYLDWVDDLDWPRAQTRLILLDTSGDTVFSNAVRQGLPYLRIPDVRHRRLDVGPPGLADRPRHETVEPVRTAVRRIYAEMVRLLETPFVLVVEDDVVPPTGVIDTLLRSMDRDVAMVAAPYLSRGSSTHYVCWDTNGWCPISDMASRGVAEVEGTGFGCTLIRRCVIEGETFVPGPGESPEYDLAFCQRLGRAGWRILADFDCPAEHRPAPPIGISEK